jgi:hypothetical protein
VDEVVPARLVLGLDPQHLRSKTAQLRREVGLVEALVRPGDDVPDQDAGCGLDDRRQRAGGGPGEDVDGDAQLCQPAGHLEHVDVHTARVAHARLVQW